MKRLVALLIWVLSLTLFCPSVPGASHYRSVRSFGQPDLGGTLPQAPLLLTSDGNLYGVSAGGLESEGTVFVLNTNNGGYKVLHQFSRYGGDGQMPSAPLAAGSDGGLYGTTYLGGSNGAGTIFRLNPDGSNYQLIYHFQTNGWDGANPNAGLAEGSDGSFYGTTQHGGSNNAGIIFRVAKAGTNYSVLHTFLANGIDGQNPRSYLLRASDGLFYGTTYSGGTNALPGGTIFKLSEDGIGYSILYHFDANTFDGAYPSAPLLEGREGTLYGTASAGGGLAGAIFKINKDGSGFSSLRSFGYYGGSSVGPSGVVEGPDNELYGTTQFGGGSSYGVIFKLSKNGTGFTNLYNFQFTGGDGQSPRGGLAPGSNGVLYGTTANGGGGDNAGTAFRINSDGTGYGIVRRFSPSGGDGSGLHAPLVLGSDGSLYGTTSRGGTNGNGTVFKIKPDGMNYAILHAFSPNSFEGRSVEAPVIEASDGILYGTAMRGGAFDNGVVFKLNKDGTGFGVVKQFFNTSGEAKTPMGGLLEASNGLLYATTSAGGANSAGTVFQLSRDGLSYQILHSFNTNGSDGRSPSAGLVQGSDGALYGTALVGGLSGYGTLFKLSTNGSAYQTIHDFANGEGQNPKAPLLKAGDGVLYGSTYGALTNPGTIYRVNQDGSGFNVLHIFIGPPDDGANCSAALVEGSDGALYGTTAGGGTDSSGTVFKLGKDGTDYCVLYHFKLTGSDGQAPSAALTKTREGTFFGTTASGGEQFFGTVFHFWPPETPDMLAVQLTGSMALVSFAGASNYQYQVSRSSDLTNWSVINSLTMPAAEVYTNVDTAPPTSASFYRAGWVP